LPMIQSGGQQTRLRIQFRPHLKDETLLKS